MWTGHQEGNIGKVANEETYVRALPGGHESFGKARIGPALRDYTQNFILA